MIYYLSQLRGGYMIEFKHVSKQYKKEIIAVRDVSFKIEKGEFVFIIGPSGAGKSTLAKLLLKEEQPSAGSIFFNGEDITNIRSRRIPLIRQDIGMVFQNFRLLENKTVYGNIDYVLQIMGASRKLKTKTINRVLETVGLQDKKKFYPRELSGGEQQRLSIARAMVTKPKVLLADEPTGNLDPETSWEIIEALQKINEAGTTIIMITHAKEIVDRLKYRVLEFSQGSLIRDEEGGMY